MLLRCKEQSPLVLTQPLRAPDHHDWANLRAEIEHLYVRKRHKLCYIMQHVERKHRLRASKQMYKKRLTQWNLQKNRRRSAPGKRVLQCQCNDTKSVPPLLHLSERHRLTFTLLQSIETWSSSYFDDLTSNASIPSSIEWHHSINAAYARTTNDFVHALKLVGTLLDRKCGILAGRVARKAFSVLDDIIMLDGPALVWNLLETMHYTITQRRYELCGMLLSYLTRLVDSRMPKSHPLWVMLSSMTSLLVDHSNSDCETRDSTSTSTCTSVPSSPASSESSNESNDHQSFDVLLDPLRQSWAMNAEIIFKHLDTAFFGLYCNIDWDLCSLRLPRNELRAAHQWFNQIEERHAQTPFTAAWQEEDYDSNISGNVDERCTYPVTTHFDSGVAKGFERLRTNSIDALRRHWDDIVAESAEFKGENTILIRILAGLVSARVLQWPISTACSSAASGVTLEVTRLYAGHVAGAIRTRLDLRREGYIDSVADHPSIFEDIRAAIGLCEYAYGRADPRVVRELWALQHGFVAAGDHEKARQVEDDAFSRLNDYVCYIPPNSA